MRYGYGGGGGREGFSSSSLESPISADLSFGGVAAWHKGLRWLWLSYVFETERLEQIPGNKPA